MLNNNYTLRAHTHTHHSTSLTHIPHRFNDSRHRRRDTHAHTHTHTTQPHTQTLTGPPSAETRQTSKFYFKLIQATHHQHVIDTSISTLTPPTGMQKQVHRLTTFIKPAAPTIETQQKLTSNTTQWLNNTLDILQTHYTSSITSITSSLQNTTPDHQALQIAIGWARKRFTHRLQQQTIQTAITTLGFTTDRHTPINSPPHQFTDTQLTSSQTNTTHTQQERDNAPPLPRTTAPYQRSLYLGPLTSLVEKVAHRTETGPIPPSLSSSPLPIDPPTSFTPHQPTLTPYQQTPSEEGPLSDPGSPEPEAPPASTTMETPPPHPGSWGPRGTDTPTQSDPDITLPSSPMQTDNETSAKDREVTVLIHSPPQFRPTIHRARPHRKIQDWHFRPIKPVLVLGDSNISRIPPYTNNQIQIDSYPGANFFHFLKICQKTPISLTTRTLILSIGINNKDQHPKLTSIKQLKALHRAAKRTFPKADIFYPVINFSPALARPQKDNLLVINDTIRSHLPSLAELPQDQFTTGPDNIHWTPNTATHIFQHWCNTLDILP